MNQKNPVDENGRPVRLRTKNNRGVIIFRIGKRINGKMRFSDNWTFRKCWNTRQFYFNLGTNRAEAEKLANEIDAFLRAPGATMEAAIAQYNPKKLEQVFPDKEKELATVGDLLHTHKKVERILELSPQTAHAYRARLVTIIRRVMAFRKGKPFKKSALHWEKQKETLAMSTAIFDRKFMQDLKLSFLKEATNLEEERQKKRTANSAIADIRALFSESAVEAYGLNLPDLSEFLEEKAWRRVGSKKYRLPPMEVIIAIGERMADLKKLTGEGTMTDRNAYMAHLLAMHAGLRAKEISHARPEWLEDGDAPRIWVTEEDDFGTKGRASRPVELERWVYEEISSLVKSPGYLIEGNKQERERGVFDRLNAHLRGCGLDVQKPTHELRKLFGSFIASTRGIFVAQKFLGHKSPQITSDTYADALLDEKLQGLWKKEELTASSAN